MKENKDENSLPFRNAEFLAHPKPCVVKGTIPEYVRGTLYRGGPSIFSTETNNSGELFKFQHRFDGAAAIHRFQIESSDKVLYSNKFTAESYLDSVKKGQLPITFAQDLCQKRFRKFFNIFKSPDAPNEAGKVLVNNVNVVLTDKFPGKDLVFLTDANSLQDIDPESLEPKSFFSYADFGGDFKGMLYGTDSVNNGILL
jgi:carotenoid cleavage dioxygenase-like enzyme